MKKPYPKPSQKVNWIVYLDDLDKVQVIPDEHDPAQRKGITLAGNKIIGYVYDDKAGAEKYGEEVLCPMK